MSARLAQAVSDRRQYHQVPASQPAREAPHVSGAYGRDGPQANRVVRPLQPAYKPQQPPSPVRPLRMEAQNTPQAQYANRPRSPVATREGYGRVGGGMHYTTSGRPNPSPPPPSYHSGSSDGAHSPMASSRAPGGFAPPALSAPVKAAFFEAPPSPGSSLHSGTGYVNEKTLGGSAVNGGAGAVKWDEDVREKVANEFRGDEERPEFWKRMSGDARRRQSGSVAFLSLSLAQDNDPWPDAFGVRRVWLSQQTGKTGKWKVLGWIITLLVLAGIGGGLAYHFTHNTGKPKEGANAPQVRASPLASCVSL